MSNSNVTVEQYCMHPYTVYGIETNTDNNCFLVQKKNCMHPYTVYGIETRLNHCLCQSDYSNCMHPYTVYGIETYIAAIWVSVMLIIACTLIPFTVLKHAGTATEGAKHIACTLIPFTVLKLQSQNPYTLWFLQYCMHPYTVYGIET